MQPLIALVDCNNFYVSCERVFRPDLIGKPVAVLRACEKIGHQEWPQSLAI